MNASNTHQPLHDAARPYVEFGIEDYEELKSTKTRLDKARQEVDKRYETLSKCHLDNMTYAKAQLDHARQKEKDCYEDFERAHNELFTAISRLVRANNDTSTRNTEELEDDADTSPLGPLPRVRPRRIRAPTRANAGPSRRVARHARISATATAAATATAPALGSAGVSSDPIIRALATRASNDASLKALMRIVATANATHSQLRAFQQIIDEVTVAVNGDIAQAASEDYIKQETATDS